MALDRLVPGVWAELADEPGHGRANAVAVVDDDGVTVVDTLMVRSQWEPFAAAVEAIGMPVRRVVLTSSNVEFAGGTNRFRMAAVYGRPQASAHLDQPADPELFRRLHPSFADEFDDEFRTRPVSHVVDAPVQLTAGGGAGAAGRPAGGEPRRRPARRVDGARRGHVRVRRHAQRRPGRPGPVGDAPRLAVGAGPIVVPGHGPVGGEEEVRALQAYLRACVDAEGDVARLADGPWREWAGASEWDPVNVERAALLAEGRDEPPADPAARRLGLTAELAVAADLRTAATASSIVLATTSADSTRTCTEAPSSSGSAMRVRTGGSRSWRSEPRSGSVPTTTASSTSPRAVAQHERLGEVDDGAVTRRLPADAPPP